MAERLSTPCGIHKFWNIFLPGCRLGVYHFNKYDKDYVYVEMPSGAKVFLRCVVFLTIKGSNNKRRFAIVHKWKKNTNAHTWEPIKGQVEEKEKKAAQRIAGKEYMPLLLEILHYTIQREIEEESKINPAHIKNLKLHKEIAYTSRHGDYPQQCMNFQYMFFTAEIAEEDFEKAQKKLLSIAADPRTALLRKDEREKDDLQLWSPSKGMNYIMGGTSSAIVRLYLHNLSKLN